MSDIDYEREVESARIKADEAKGAHDRKAQLYRTHFEIASKSAEAVVKTSVVVNGGAAVAVLAFLSGIVGKQAASVKQVADVATSLMWFASGVAAGVGALALIYLMHHSLASRVKSLKDTFLQPWEQPTNMTPLWTKVYAASHALAVVIALLSLFLFIMGVWEVRDAITRLAV